VVELIAHCGVMLGGIFQPLMGLQLLDAAALALVVFEHTAQEVDAFPRQFAALLQMFPQIAFLN